MPVTKVKIPARPVVQVMFTPATGGDPQDVTDSALPVEFGTEGNQFELKMHKWRYNLKTTNYSAPGAYTVTMIPGANYTISPTCQATFVIE